MSIIILTVEGDKATLDFGDAKIADASTIHKKIPKTVLHLTVVGKKIVNLGDNFLSGCDNLTSLDLTPLKNVTEIGDAFLSFAMRLESVDMLPLQKIRSVGKKDFLLWCDAKISIHPKFEKRLKKWGTRNLRYLE